MKKNIILTGAAMFVALILIGAGCSGNTGAVDDNGKKTNDVSQGQAGRYESYDESKLSLAATGNVVLFFKADWCSTCRALDADIRRNLTSIPSDVTILRLNYDKELTLRRKYGVTTQHTLVQVDSAGTMLGKWVGSMTLAEVIKRVQ